MKVLFVSLKHEYGNPALGLSFEYRQFYDALSRMENVHVSFFAIDEIMQQWGRDGMNQRLVELVEETKPDLLFCFLFTEEIKKETIRHITKKTSTKTFNWFADDHWRFPIFSKYWAPLFTAISTTDSQAVAKYKKLGIEVIKTQWGFNPHAYAPQDAAVNPHSYDITFVGKKYGKREAYIQQLQQQGLPAVGFGKGWESGIVDDSTMLKIFSYSKINLNFTESYSSPLNLLAKLVVKKELGKYSLNVQHFFGNAQSVINTRRRQIKGRTFEIPACGGFLVTGDADNLADYYVPGKEIVVFQDADDLLEKCRYYLEHADKAQAIAQAGYARTIQDHSYTRRFGNIFTALGLG